MTRVPPRSLPAALGPPLALLAVGAAGCAAVLLADPTSPGSWLPLCPTKALTGVCCPGCGGFRMLYSLLHGRFLDALHYNAVTLVFLGLFAWSAVAWTAGRVRGRHVRSWLHRRWAPHAAITVLALWFVLRNVPWTGLAV